MKCTATGAPYRVFGYKGKQVRDNIHSADLVRAFIRYFEAPGPGKVYNIGGGRYANCSMLEAIDFCQEITGRELSWTYVDENRIGDHLWWISDLTRFEADYPGWEITKDIDSILRDIAHAYAAIP
jgi:CDP-paratose 2-epimerase